MSAPLSIGIDLGGTKLLGVVVDEAGQVIAESLVATPCGPAAIVDAVAGLVADLGGAAAIGVGAPGLVERDGVLRTAPNLPGVHDLDLRAALTDRYPELVVRIDNDATCAAWGEYQAGAAVGASDAVLVTLGTGIGGGLVIGGRLARGYRGFAGEVGHMMVDPDGPPCPCGQRGCWERYASGSALARLGREAAPARVVELAGGDVEAVRGEHVTAAAAEGDDEAVAVVDRFCWWLARGLANLVDILDPEVVVLGGGLIEAQELILAPSRTHLATLVLGGPTRPPPPILPATLGERAGAIGAALLAQAPQRSV